MTENKKTSCKECLQTQTQRGLCRKCYGKKWRQAKQKHHPDYSKPKKLIFVCMKCHTHIHKPLNFPYKNGARR